MKKSAKHKRQRRSVSSRRLDTTKNVLSPSVEQAVQQAAEAARKLAEKYGFRATARSA